MFVYWSELEPSANAVRFRFEDQQTFTIRMSPEDIRRNQQEAEIGVVYATGGKFERQSTIGELLLRPAEDAAIKVELLRDDVVSDCSDYVVRNISGRACDASWQETAPEGEGDR